MRESCGKSLKLCGIDRSFSGSRLADWLRGRHPAKTAAAVAAATGAPERTVESWLAGASAPSAVWILALVGAYGPQALAAMYETPPDWLDAAARAARRAELDARIAEMTAARDAR